MGKIAYCWEIGGGLGHITAFFPIAQRLQEKGHEVIFIVKDLRFTDQLIGQQGFKVFQAPIWPQRLENLPRAESYSELLFMFGYLDKERLSDIVVGWRNILQAFAPDLAVFDFSPTASIAARSLSVKRVHLGLGYWLPPQASPLPSFRSWEQIPLQRLQMSENEVLQSINFALERIGAQQMKKMKNLFDCNEIFLATFPELDQYKNRGPARYWGPLMSMDEGEAPVWPDAKPGPNIFAYLKENKISHKILAMLKRLDANVLVYTTGFSQARIDNFQTERLRIVPKMLNLKKVCKKCDLVICHGGTATVARALLGGVPLVILPTQDEQLIIAHNVVKLGAGTMVSQDDKQPDYPGAIHTALTDKKIKKNAERFAAKHADFDQLEQISSIVRRMEELIGRAL